MKNMDNLPAQPTKLDNQSTKERASRNAAQEPKAKNFGKDHSPAKSSVKSLHTGTNVKAAVAKNASTKSIPKLGGNRFNKCILKAESKNQSSRTSLSTNEVQKGATSAGITKKNKSPTTATTAHTPTGKSKIPAMKRTSHAPAGGANQQTKTKTVPRQKSLLKTTTENSKEITKPAPPKPSSPPTVSISKSSISLTKLESKDPICMSEIVSKRSFITERMTPIQVKITPKSQLARSSSISPSPGFTKRSVSNISTRSTPCPRNKDEFETNLRKMTSTAGDQNKIENLQKKLETAQTEFLTQIQKLKETSPDKYSCEYKFVTLVKDDQSKLIAKEGELRQLPKKFPSASVNDFKQKLKNYMEAWFSNLKDDLKENDNADIQRVKEKLEQLECLKSHDILSFIDDLCAQRGDETDLQLTKLKKDLDETKKALKKSENKLNEWMKQHEEHCIKLEKELKSKAENDLSKKDGEIKDLQKKLKSHEKQIDLLKISIHNSEKEFECEKAKLTEELQTCRECIASTNKRLQSSEQQHTLEKKELKTKNETIKRLEGELVEKKKLAESLSEMTTKVEELQAKVKAKDKHCKECVEHLKQIAEMKSKIEALESDKDALTQQVEELQKASMDQEKLQNMLKETERKTHDLRKQLEDKEKLLELTPQYTKNFQQEFAKFRQCDAEKRREIEKLKGDLSKAQFNVCQLEQQIQRDQQLLDVRSELINSLQTNEKNHRIHMEELFAQVGEKNNTINELNAELQTKSEEFRNLFTNLSTKQMEVANQEHIIKLLEESNERSQMLRVKQEEKIGHLEDELAHLKHTISIYQGNILSGNASKQLLFAPVLHPTTTNDYNQNFYYYANQRKRKRHVDINVKKYEA